MNYNYLVPANTKKQGLIFGLLNKVDYIILAVGVGLSFGIFLLPNTVLDKGGFLGAMIAIAPAFIAVFLIFPIPNYHNTLTFIKSALNFFLERQKFVWKGWCCRDGEEEQLRALEQGDLQHAVELNVKQQAAPVTVAEVARAIGVEEAAAQACLEEAGLGKAQLARECAPRMDASRFDALVEEAVREGKAVAVGGLVGHPSAVGAAQAAKDQEADQLLAEMLRVGTTPPPLKYLFEQAGLGQNEGRQALTKLVHDGRAQRITEELFLATETLDSCKQAIRAHLAAGGEGTVAALKDAMNTSRKFAVPLLEYFDTHGVTKRDGDIRSAV